MENLEKKHLGDWILSLNVYEKRLIEYLEPILQNENAQLVEIEVSNLGHKKTVCIRLDEADSSKRISLDRLSYFSAFVGDALAALDAQESLFAGAYLLQLSSPGLDRPLCKRAHFEQALAKEVLVKTFAHSQLPKLIRGKIAKVVDNELVVIGQNESGEIAYRILWQYIRRAQLVYEFARPTKISKKKK